VPDRRHDGQRVQREVVKEHAFNAQAHRITSCVEFNGWKDEYRVKKVGEKRMKIDIRHEF
jgi:hypothetical protein